MNVFRVLDVIARVARDNHRRQTARRRSRVISRLRGAASADKGVAAVVVDEIGAKLSVQRLKHIVHGHPKLPAVAGIAISVTAHQHALAIHVDASRCQCGQVSYIQRRALVQHPVVIAATIGNHVGLREKCAAVIGLGLLPIQLIKRFGRQVVRQILRNIKQINRH